MAVTRASRKGPPAARPLPAPAIRVESGEIFYDSGSTVIEYVHGDTPARCLAICFSPDDHIDVRSVGYQQQSLRKAGFDVLAVKQAAVPGYADLTPASIAEILAKLPAYEGVVALGAESGAFAALRLLGQFDGLPIVALSPHLHGKPGPAEAIKANAYVAFDPKTKAGRASCRDVIAQYPRVRLLRLHSAGDSVRLALEEADMLPPMLDALASRTPIDPAAYFRANRAKSPIILYYMAAHATKRRHFHAARSLMARAVAIDDQGPIALAYSRALADSGDLPSAVVEIDKLLAREPNVSHHWAAKSYIHELAGDDPAALDAIRHAIELEPDFEHFRVPERRLLDRLYSEMAKRNQMTIAALEKARGELNMKRGFVESDAFDARGMAGLIVFSLLIVGLVATLAITFRLI